MSTCHFGPDTTHLGPPDTGNAVCVVARFAEPGADPFPRCHETPHSCVDTRAWPAGKRFLTETRHAVSGCRAGLAAVGFASLARLRARESSRFVGRTRQWEYVHLGNDVFHRVDIPWWPGTSRPPARADRPGGSMDA